MMETYRGQVRSPADAIKLFEACRLGLLPRVQRRLSEKERQAIRSGSVFVWDEREAGMRRWTDGKSWSASRVSGSFLTYREMEGKRGSSSYLPTAKRTAGKTPDSAKASDDDQDMDGEGPDGYRYKPDGLMKQSFSITTSTGQHLHLISYYARPSSHMTDLPQPTTDAALRHITPPKGMYPESTVHETAPRPSPSAPLFNHGQPPPPQGRNGHYSPGYPQWPAPLNTPPYSGYPPQQGYGHFSPPQGPYGQYPPQHMPYQQPPNGYDGRHIQLPPSTLPHPQQPGSPYSPGSSAPQAMAMQHRPSFSSSQLMPPLDQRRGSGPSPHLPPPHQSSYYQGQKPPSPGDRPNPLYSGPSSANGTSYASNGHAHSGAQTNPSPRLPAVTSPPASQQSTSIPSISNIVHGSPGTLAAMPALSKTTSALSTMSSHSNGASNGNANGSSTDRRTPVSPGQQLRAEMEGSAGRNSRSPRGAAPGGSPQAEATNGDSREGERRQIINHAMSKSVLMQDREAINVLNRKFCI